MDSEKEPSFEESMFLDIMRSMTKDKRDQDMKKVKRGKISDDAKKL